MLHQMLVRLLLKRKHSYAKAVRLGGKVFILKVEEYVAAQTFLNKAKEMGFLDSVSANSEHRAP